MRARENSGEVDELVEKAGRALVVDRAEPVFWNAPKWHPGDPARQLAQLLGIKRQFRAFLEDSTPVVAGYGIGNRFHDKSIDSNVWVASQKAAIGFRNGATTHYVEIGERALLHDIDSDFDLGVVPRPPFTESDVTNAVDGLPLDMGLREQPAGQITRSEILYGAQSFANKS